MMSCSVSDVFVYGSDLLGRNSFTRSTFPMCASALAVKIDCTQEGMVEGVGCGPVMVKSTPTSVKGIGGVEGLSRLGSGQKETSSGRRLGHAGMSLFFIL